MARRNRFGWRNDPARAAAQPNNLVDLNRRRARSKRGRRLEQKRRAA